MPDAGAHKLQRIFSRFAVYLIAAMWGSAFSMPAVVDPDYDVQLIASGLVSATGMVIAPTGDIFVSTYFDGATTSILRVDPHTSVVQTYATGFSYSTDLAFDSAGRLFVLSGSGAPRNIYEVHSDGSSVLYKTGFSYSVGMVASPDGGLYVANSGDGTVSHISSSGVTSTYLAGFSVSGGPHGLALNPWGDLYFVEHATGRIFEYTAGGSLSLLATLTPFGSTFLAVAPSGAVFVADSLNGSIFKIESGTINTFAMGFAGKSNPPKIGPGDLAFDAVGNLYVADADSLWRFSPNSMSVPETQTALLLVIGLLLLTLVRAHRPLTFRDHTDA